MNLGKSIKCIRTDMGISQKDMAVAMSITPTFLSHLENNSATASWKTIERVANYLNVTEDYILIRAIGVEDFAGLPKSQQMEMKHVIEAALLNLNQNHEVYSKSN